MPAPGLKDVLKLQEAEDKKSTIIVSAYGDMSNIRTAMNRGAFDFLLTALSHHFLSRHEAFKGVVSETTIIPASRREAKPPEPPTPPESAHGHRRIGLHQ